MFSLTTFGSAGDLSYDPDGLKYKSAFMNLGGKFSCKLSELKKIDQSKYIDFLVFPRKCLVLFLENGKTFKFKFASENDMSDFFIFCKENNITNFYR